MLTSKFDSGSVGEKYRGTIMWQNGTSTEVLIKGARV
jgi:hypothetical protein